MEKIKKWLRVDDQDGSGSGDGSGTGDGSGSGSGYGYGDGSGTGYGDGYGSGSGYGDGYGSGSGSGSGEGSGSGYGSGTGYGDGVKSLNGKIVSVIDNVQTIITSIHMNLAKGFILQSDLTLQPCYVAKAGRLFAHGETPGKAQEALREKMFENMDTDEAIEKFCETFENGEHYPGHDFFKWHHYLTGSCEMGRNSFVRNHDIDLDKTYTVQEFIRWTENDYGGQIIEKLKERYS